MSLFRGLRPMIFGAIIALGIKGVARAQCADCGSFFEVDPAVSLNGFAVLSGAIVLLFEAYRSRP